MPLPQIDMTNAEPSYSIEYWDDDQWIYRRIDSASTYTQAQRNLERAIRRKPNTKYRVVKLQEVMYYEPPTATDQPPTP